MLVDVTKTPFSRYGSYMCLSIVPPSWGHKGLLIRSMHGSGSCREVFRIALVKDGAELDYTVEVSPWLCVLSGDAAEAYITFAARDCIRVRVNGALLRLVPIRTDGMQLFSAGPGILYVNNPACNCRHLLTALAGTVSAKEVLQVDNLKRDAKPDRRPPPAVAVEMVPAGNGIAECAIEEFVTTPARSGLAGTFGACVKEMERDWNQWHETMPAVPPAYREGARMAMYVNYESVIGPGGFLRRDTMLMSKNWMTQCWSWDHCFNAIALSYKAPDRAWDQLMIHFDLQDPHGALPDGVNAESAGWNYCKPPIHGWALSKMMASRKLLTRARLREIYPKLTRWTLWWLEKRDYDGDGLPEYLNGNDSGWDNATVYDGGFPVTGPDCAAFLVVQMDVLARLARRLGKNADARRWKKRADTLVGTMIDRLWIDGQFRAKKAFTGEVFPGGDSLINFLPVILGKRLPKKYRDVIAAALVPDGRFVTAYGPATENPKSPLYLENGYWRGPIWGPVVVLLADGLARSGYTVQAREIARRYCDMCLKTMTFAENYSPLNGEPLCDQGYTWGSSAYLILAHEFLKPGRSPD